MCIGHMFRDVPVGFMLISKVATILKQGEQDVFKFNCNFLSSLSINRWINAPYSKVRVG